MWIDAPAHAPAGCDRADSKRVAVELSPFKVGRIESAAALAGRETSRLVLGQRASVIIRPSTNNWLRFAPRSQVWLVLRWTRPPFRDQPRTTSAPLTVTTSFW